MKKRGINIEGIKTGSKLEMKVQSHCSQAFLTSAVKNACEQLPEDCKLLFLNEIKGEGYTDEFVKNRVEQVSSQLESKFEELMEKLNEVDSLEGINKVLKSIVDDIKVEGPTKQK